MDETFRRLSALHRHLCHELRRDRYATEAFHLESEVVLGLLRQIGPEIEREQWRKAARGGA